MYTSTNKASKNSMPGNANRGVVGYLEIPPQRKILKMPPSKFWENFLKNREKLMNLG